MTPQNGKLPLANFIHLTWLAKYLQNNLDDIFACGNNCGFPELEHQKKKKQQKKKIQEDDFQAEIQ